MIRIVIADDHTVLRQGLRLILSTDPNLTVVGEAGSGQGAVDLALALSPDVMLMDVEMPDVNGVEATRRIRAACPETQVLMLTVSDKSEDLIGALRAGARGYLLKNAEAQQVLDAIQRVASGEAVLSPGLTARLLDEIVVPTPSIERLTERESDVFDLLIQGLSNKEIAAALSVSENTVKTHVRHILDKLNLRSRSEVAAYAARTGLIATD
jgi:DNA-binding NarL/FixJ family response regulator